MEHEANWGLDGDGVVENLFYYLWCKDEFGGGPSLLIPDTVVYKFTQPAFWYFTSKSGKVKKKAKASLTNVQIEKEFCRKSCGVDIVAYYIYMLNDAPTIEYFNADGLKDFLYTRQKIYNGVLQRFVVPKGSCNSMIRAIWTPKMCLLERKTNVRRLHDVRYGLYERAVTFDGADAYSNPDPVRGSILPGDIQYLCEQIVDHVMEVSFHKHRISRMVLHLKTDSDDKVWLLWSSSVRLAHAAASASDPVKPVDINSDAHVPSFVHLNVMPDGKPQSKLRQFTACRSCGASIEAAVSSTVTYKAILEHFRQLLHAMKVDMMRRPGPTAAVLWPPDESIILAAGGVGFGALRDALADTTAPAAPRRPAIAKPITETDVTIPPMLRHLHPHLTVDAFARFSHDPVFLYKTTTVCTDCFLVFADYSTSALEVNTLRQDAPAVLRPQREIPPLKQVTPRKHLPDSAWMPQRRKGPPGASTNQHIAMAKSQYTFKTPPSLPQRIDHTMLDEVQRQLPSELMRSSASAPTLRPPVEHKDPPPATAAPYIPEAWRLQPTMVPNPLAGHATNALTTTAKEDSFFTELTASSMTLSQHHPLRHMVESAAKLTVTPSTTAASPTREGPGPPRKARAARNPYTVVQTLRDDPASSPKPPKKTHKKLSKKGSAANLTFQRLAPTEEERLTSLKHREFLLQSLHEIQHQIANPDALSDVLDGTPPSKQATSTQVRRTPAFDEEATYSAKPTPAEKIATKQPTKSPRDVNFPEHIPKIVTISDDPRKDSDDPSEYAAKAPGIQGSSGRRAAPDEESDALHSTTAVPATDAATALPHASSPEPLDKAESTQSARPVPSTPILQSTIEGPPSTVSTLGSRRSDDDAAISDELDGSDEPNDVNDQLPRPNTHQLVDHGMESDRPSTTPSDELFPVSHAQHDDPSAARATDAQATQGLWGDLPPDDDQEDDDLLRSPPPTPAADLGGQSDANDDDKAMYL